jgi:hypothetical protein
MGLVLFWGQQQLTLLLPATSLVNEALLVGILAGGGGAIYLAGIWALKIEEIGLLAAAVRGKIGSGKRD